MFYYNFLNNYLDYGFANNGVTLPFLAGLQTEIITVSEVLDELSSLEHGKYISVQLCDNINEIVFGVYYDEGDLEQYTKYGSLIILNKSLAKYSSQELRKLLERMYDSLIMDSLYSKNNGYWSDYSDLEKTQIAQCLS